MTLPAALAMGRRGMMHRLLGARRQVRSIHNTTASATLAVPGDGVFESLKQRLLAINTPAGKSLAAIGSLAVSVTTHDSEPAPPATRTAVRESPVALFQQTYELDVHMHVHHMHPYTTDTHSHYTMTHTHRTHRTHRTHTAHAHSHIHNDERIHTHTHSYYTMPLSHTTHMYTHAPIRTLSGRLRQGRTAGDGFKVAANPTEQEICWGGPNSHLLQRLPLVHRELYGIQQRSAALHCTRHPSCA